MAASATASRIGPSPSSSSAARAGLPEPEIMRVTRHRSVAVLRRYVREGDLFTRNVTGEIGL
jgi:hypothetical protein